MEECGRAGGLFEFCGTKYALKDMRFRDPCAFVNYNVLVSFLVPLVVRDKQNFQSSSDCGTTATSSQA